MEEIVYNSVKAYLDTLANLGYVRLTDLDKLLLLILIEEFTLQDFKGYISKEDYEEIDKFLYTLFGKSCLIPYPNFCKIKDMNRLHLGDMSELANRVKVIEDTQIVKTHGNVIETIADIVPVA